MNIARTRPAGLIKAVRLCAFVGAYAAFLLNGPLLGMLGWQYDAAARSPFTKIAPATYLFVIGGVLAIFSGRRRFLSVAKTPWFLIYCIVAALVTVRAAFVTEASGGELSTALVSFVTPPLALLCLQLPREDLDLIGRGLRVFFFINSLMALAERAVGHRFIPSFLDQYPTEHRAAALLAHPLLGALLTGELIIILIIAPKRDLSLPIRAAEIFVLLLAMFAYGGRTALVFLPFMLVAYAVLARNRAGDSHISVMQRLAPLVLAAVGILFVFLPIPFVEATLQRFTEDNGSALTRSAALNIAGELDTHGLLFGVDIYRRVTLQAFFNTSQGIELGWVGLLLTYGAIVTTALAIAMPIFLFGIASKLNRGAFYTVLYFLVITAGSAGLANKGLLLTTLLILMVTLCQRDGALLEVVREVRARKVAP